MRRRLVSSSEAVPAKSQHKKPCSDCPWSRTSLNGWLGANTAEEWVDIAHGEAQVECHSLTGVQCAGIAIYRANVYKLPRNRTILRLPRDESLVFKSIAEFLAYHKRMPNMSTNLTEVPYDKIIEILDAVESDTEGVTRKQCREFLQELRSSIEIRLDGLGPEEDDEDDS
jgi:hypothetical protein